MTHIVAIAQASFADPWMPRSFQEAVEQSLNGDRTIVLVALRDSAVCGYAIAWTVGDEGELADVAVAESKRGHGIGRRLVEAILPVCAARGAERIFLEVRVSNDRAQRLYERCGFARIGVRRRYYRNDEDALVMEKVL
ncbi:MAG: ribosomal protein S18-alanine N-acetyltransferase [Armatimonadota bacterium]|nr:ribosomal protein S18-alanine N-acetyltransferase [Armatimonadota bacterium]